MMIYREHPFCIGQEAVTARPGGTSQVVWPCGLTWTVESDVLNRIDGVPATFHNAVFNEHVAQPHRMDAEDAMAYIEAGAANPDVAWMRSYVLGPAV